MQVLPLPAAAQDAQQCFYEPAGGLESGLARDPAGRLRSYVYQPKQPGAHPWVRYYAGSVALAERCV